ncbi:protoporphyrinogen oxidase [Candidatus Poribacteria bacterium]|nr:protoporphyrinogen oxidase [Candidatus Poribacteria bacterium]
MFIQLRTTVMEQERKRAIVVGGGITGLAAAYRLKREAEERGISLDISLLEASDRVGGVIQTEHRDGFIIEHGPDAFISTKPWAKALCEELGIDDKLIGTNPKVRRSFVIRKGKLVPVPEGFYMMAPGAFVPFLKSPIFSLVGKLRIALDLFISRRSDIDDESVADFVRRRLGTEAFERMAQPMIGGIYTSDAENLSLKSTFPRFLEMEQEHGSIIKALLAQKRKASQTSRDTSGPRYSLFLSFTGGMQTLVDALAENLSECIRLGCSVATIQKIENEEGWRVCLDNDEVLETDLLCIALPAPQTSKILSKVSPFLSEKLSDIPYTSSATVNIAFRREDVPHPLNGMGFVVPIKEQLNLIGCSFSSVKFENRAPSNHALLRAFVSESATNVKGAANNNTEFNDITSSALIDVSNLLGITKPPLFLVVSQHTQSMAQYQVGHEKLVGEIDELANGLPGLTLAGNAYHGIGIPDCINSGEQAAISLLNNINI